VPPYAQEHEQHDLSDDEETCEEEQPAPPAPPDSRRRSFGVHSRATISCPFCPSTPRTVNSLRAIARSVITLSVFT
jgi:hypothetical protein